jgi:transcription initiation factor TFIID TATA-box-binding protein
MDLPIVQNIMSTVNLGCSLDLHYIASNSYNVEYEPERFNPIIMRLKKPRSTALIFGTGKIVVTGTKDENSSKIAARRYARIIQKLGFPVKFLNFKITNMVASGNLDLKSKFCNFCEREKSLVDYKPELFPGIFYRNNVTIIIFPTGKIIFTNAQSREQIYISFVKFINSLGTLTPS